MCHPIHTWFTLCIIDNCWVTNSIRAWVKAYIRVVEQSRPGVGWKVNFEKEYKRTWRLTKYNRYFEHVNDQSKYTMWKERGYTCSPESFGNLFSIGPLSVSSRRPTRIASGLAGRLLCCGPCFQNIQTQRMSCIMWQFRKYTQCIWHATDPLSTKDDKKCCGI